MNEMKRVNSVRTSVNAHVSQRVDTLRQLFTTKDVAQNNLEGWEKAHHELLTLQEANVSDPRFFSSVILYQPCLR